jgi:hypothetical protein
VPKALNSRSLRQILLALPFSRRRFIAPIRSASRRDGEHVVRYLRRPWRFTPEYAIDAKGRRSLDASFQKNE